MTQQSTSPPAAPLPLEYAATRTRSARMYLIQWLNLFGTFIALLVIYGLFCALTPSTFLSWRTVETIARQTTIVGIASMGMTLIIISGGIDLSVGSIVALTTVVTGLALQHGAPPLVAAICGILAGGLCGLANGA